MKTYTSTDLTYWEIRSNTNTLNVKTICSEIENAKKGIGGINIGASYQREYKFTRKDESALIESLLAGIPIPIIYLASDTTKIPHISNVIDGHHRLKAIYRFVNNKFKLTGLVKYHFLNDLNFEELDISIKNKLLYQVSLNFQSIHVQDDPELEYEIFTRYNKGTNQLTPQEIRNVVYRGPFMDWVNSFTKTIVENENLKEIYNASTKRLKDKNIESEIIIIASIFLRGVNDKYYSSTEYIIDLLKYTNKLETEKLNDLIIEIEKFFRFFNRIMLLLVEEKNIQNPCSKEIYKEPTYRNHKFQISLVMIIIYFFKRNYDSLKIQNIDIIHKSISEGIIKSGFDKITSSTTKPSIIKDVVSYIEIEFNAINKKF